MMIRNYLSQLFTDIDAVHVFVGSRRVIIFVSGKPNLKEREKIKQTTSEKLGLEVKCVDTVVSMTWGVGDIEKWNPSDNQKKDLKAAYDNFVSVLQKYGVEYGTTQGPILEL